jgi:hypothetical protein
MYDLNYTPTTLGVQSWREIISGSTRENRLNTTAVDIPQLWCKGASRILSCWGLICYIRSVYWYGLSWTTACICLPFLSVVLPWKDTEGVDVIFTPFHYIYIIPYWAEFILNSWGLIAYLVSIPLSVLWRVFGNWRYTNWMTSYINGR